MSTLIDRKPRWYAIYTRPRHEKIVAENCELQKIEHYLPTHRVLKKYSDRKKWVDEVIFKSYVFVRIGLKDYRRVMDTDGVANFIRFSNKPESIPDNQMEMVRLTLDADVDVEVNTEKYDIGDIVKVVQGPLAGLVGNLQEIQGKHKIVISIDSIGQNLLVTAPVKYLVKIEGAEEKKENINRLQKRFRTSG